MVLILAVVYFPVFTGAISFFRDSAHWNYPARWFFHASVRKGQFPLWNPDEGLGFPLLGNPLFGLFYPPNWLFLLGGADTVARMLTWQSLAHLMAGSVGITLLAARLGASRVGAIVAGLTWGLSGYTTAMWTAGLLLPAGAWVPWCGVGYLALARSLDGPPWRWLTGIVKAALPVGMALLMGEIFVALMGIGFGLATAAADGLANRDRDRDAGGGLEGGGHQVAGRRAGASAPAPPGPWRGARRLVPVAAALLLGVAMGAINLLPARALASTTQRARPLPRFLAESCSLHPLRLVEMIVPGSMGDPFEDYPAAPIVGEPLIDGWPLSYGVYMGASAVVLALVGIGRRRSLANVIAGLALVSLLLALGKHTPLHQVVRTIVRPLAYMRYPEKYLVLFVGWLSILAGLGATRWLASGARPWRRAWLFLGLLAIIGLLALVHVGFPEELRPFVSRGVVSAGAGVLGVIAAGWLRPRHPRAGVTLLVACLALDLAAAVWPLQVFQPARLATDVPAAARALLADAAAGGVPVALPRVYRAERTEGTVRRWVPVRNLSLGEFRSIETLIPNTVTTYGIASLPGYDAAIPTFLGLLWSYGESRRQTVLRLLGVGYAVLPIDNPRDPVEHRTGLVPLMDPLPGSRLYRVPDVLPRVYLVGQDAAAVVPDEEAVRHLLDDDVVAGRKVLLAPTPAAGPLRAGGGHQAAGDCALMTFTNNTVVGHCRATRPGVAVFVEQFDIGWRATVDGQPTDVLRANGLLRAVKLEAGAHVIVLRYTPPALAWGAALSLVSAALVLVLAALAARDRRDGALRIQPSGGGPEVGT